MLGMAIVVLFCLPGTAMGAFFARSLVEYASWRWIYYIYIIAQSTFTCSNSVASQLADNF